MIQPTPPKILAEVASGQISTFDCPPDVSDSDCRNVYGGDPDIRRLNPGVDFPSGSVQFTIRAEHSATNLAFTSWLKSAQSCTDALLPVIWTLRMCGTGAPYWISLRAQRDWSPLTIELMRAGAAYGARIAWARAALRASRAWPSACQ